MNFIRTYLPVIILAALLLLGGGYWLYWHIKPFTDNAFVFANTRPVSPWTAGYITGIFVKNNQFVSKGAPLFAVFSPPYQLKARELEQEKEALSAQLKSAEARWQAALEEIKTFRADVEKFTYFYERGKAMFKTSAVSEDYVVDQKRNLKVALARLTAAEHTAEALKHDCTLLQAQIKKTQAALELQQIWCQQTVVTALSDGYVVNMTLSPGGYYKPGDVLFAFIDTTQWYVQANFKESELSEIRPGTGAVIRLRQYPGKVYYGVVESSRLSAERRMTAGRSGMTEVKKENEWFPLPQRFPVQIKISNPDKLLNFGASAYVTLDIPSHPFRQFFWELFL